MDSSTWTKRIWKSSDHRLHRCCEHYHQQQPGLALCQVLGKALKRVQKKGRVFYIILGGGVSSKEGLSTGAERFFNFFTMQSQHLKVSLYSYKCCLKFLITFSHLELQTFIIKITFQKHGIWLQTHLQFGISPTVPRSTGPAEAGLALWQAPVRCIWPRWWYIKHCN
jgi:hypothetical protein